MSILLRRAGSHKTWLIDHRAILDFDYQRSRFFYNGLFYNSIAAMVTAGFYTDETVGDSASVSGLLPSAFTLYARGVTGVLDTDDTQTILSVDDGSDAGTASLQAVGLVRSHGGGTRQYRYIVNTASNQVLLTTTAGTPETDGTVVRMAARVKLNSCSVSVNGAASLNDTAVTLPTGMVRIGIGRWGGVDAGHGDWKGTVHRVAVLNWDTTNAELAAMDGT